MPNILQKYFGWIVAVLLAVSAVLGAWGLWPLLFPPVQVFAPLNHTCFLHDAPCTAHFPGGGQVTLSLGPRPLRPLALFDIELQTTGLNPSQVEVDLSGVDMYMGFNRPRLIAQGGGHFSGQGALPVCTVTRMDWEAKVLIYTAEGLYAAPFRFTVETR